MDDYKICRICLRKNLKCYDLETYNLRALYEDLTNTTMSCEVTFPQLLCFECSASLIKFHRFKENCVRAQNLLKLQSKTEQFTSLKDLDPDLFEYITKSTLNYMTETKRVGVFFYKEDTPESTFVSNIPNYILDIKHENHITENDTPDTVTEVNDKDYFEEEHLKSIKIEEFEICLNTSPAKKEEEEHKNPKLSKRIPKPKKNKVKIKFAKQKSSEYKLDETKWKIETLSEEEASREFDAKAKSVSYQKAKYRCMTCFKVFINADTLLRHQLFHKESRGKHECTFCKRRYNWEGTLRAHMKLHFKRYHCIQCNAVFKTIAQVKLHEKYHKGLVYSCKFCDLEFSNCSTYYTHVRMNHRSEFVCQKCGASFVSKSGLNQHTKLIHPQDNGTAIEKSTDKTEIANKCLKCDMTFETAEAYSKHINNSVMHVYDESEEANDEKIKLMKPKLSQPSAIPTTCKQCGQKFKSRKSYVSHCRAHGCQVIGKRCICEICGALIAQVGIKQHMNLHTRAVSYPCDICGKVFGAPTNLTRHLVIHTGDKPYSCELCDKKFAQPTNMKLHVKTFHMKQPYPRSNKKKKEKKILNVKT